MIEIIENIGNKTDFIHFLYLLSKDFEKNSLKWENQTIPEFHEQMASWVEDYSTCPANDIEWEKIDFKVLGRKQCWFTIDIGADYLG